jgi:LAO/AO transport system kinase
LAEALQIGCHQLPHLGKNPVAELQQRCGQPITLTMTSPPQPTAQPLDWTHPERLIAAMRAGDRRVTSAVVTELEKASARMPALIAALTPHLGRALVVGFTGPPGAGKSTLVNAYVEALRRDGKSIGIIAVDPSSPVSGGAILGDRLRMTATLADDGVFMRSLAAGGHLGGLCPAAVRVIDALDGAGKDVVVLETVGTGQSEIDVADVADVRVVLSAPGLGDDIQAMKSGLLEIADVLVVNKADRPGAEETLYQLVSALKLRSADVAPVALKTCAVNGEGVAALAAEIARVGALKLAVPAIERRRRRARFLIARAAADLVARHVRHDAANALAGLTDALLEGRTSPEAAARGMLGGLLASNRR